MERFTLAELESMPTLHVGQYDDLKAEEEILGTPVRVWLSRMGMADGQPYRNQVTVQECRDGRWETVEEYEAT